MPYLTGDTPADLCTLSIVVPDDAMIRRAIFGQFLELSELRNWEQFGSGTPSEVASAMFDALNTFSWCSAGGGVTMLVEAYRNQALFAQSTMPTKLTGLTFVTHNTGQWDAANERVVIDADGLYCVQVVMRGPANVSYLGAYVYVNSTAFIGDVWYKSSVTPLATPHFTLALLDGDIVEVYGLQQGDTFIYTNQGRLGFLIYRAGDLP